MENGHVPLNYQPIFGQTTKMEMITGEADFSVSCGMNREDGKADGLMVQKLDLVVGLLCEIVVQLKILLVLCVCILVINLYGRIGWCELWWQ
jgi:hypothetical protein